MLDALSFTIYTYADIKECEIGTHNCSQLCIELPGGFKCSCYHGYQLQADDNITCEGIPLLLNTSSIYMSYFTKNIH